MWRETADALGMIVVAPQEMGKNEGYEFKEEERETALSALRWARRKFNVDENRVHATGVSRGGHLTWDLALRHPDLWASASPMIGGPRTANAKGQNNIRFLENVVHLPLRDLQGSKDHPLLLAALRTSFEKLTAFGAADARLIEFPELSHSFEFGAVDWKEFLGGAKRDPRRDHVVRLTVDKDEARSAWAEVTGLGRGAKEDITLKVDAKEWAAMDEGQQRAAYIAQAEKLTARLVVDRKGPGSYAAIGRYVDRFRILLREEDLPAEGDVVVSFNGKEQKHKTKADARVLLREFVERFDRTFLPVAAVEVR